jgi:Fe-S-cluster-containing dehydrogenase component
MPKWGMVIDLEKCTGCQACTAACAMENNLLPGENWGEVIFFEEGRYPNVKVTWLPRPCMHCENPSCRDVCPTGATHVTEDGAVLVDWNRCIGCKYCQIACPYGARFYMETKPLAEPDPKRVFKSADNKRSWDPPYRMPDENEDWSNGIGVQPPGVVSKCTFCYHKVRNAPKGVADLDESVAELREFVPACVRTCAPKARYFGDLENPNSNVSKLIAEKKGVRLLDHLGNKPKVYYLAGRGPTVPARALKA